MFDWIKKALERAASMFTSRGPSDEAAPCPLKQAGILVQALRDDKDEPVSGVSVTLTKGKTSGSGSTDGTNGWIEFKPVEPDTYGVDYDLAGSSAEGFKVIREPGSQSVSAGRTAVMMLIVNPVGTLKVRVVDDADDTAIKEVEVTVRPAPENTAGETQQVEPNGAAVEFASGKYEIVTSASTELFKKPDVVSVEVPENALGEAEVRLIRLHSVSFELVDEEGVAIEGLIVVKAKFSDGSVRERMAGEGSVVTFPDVPIGDCEVVEITHEKELFEFHDIEMA